MTNKRHVEILLKQSNIVGMHHTPQSRIKWIDHMIKNNVLKDMGYSIDFWMETQKQLRDKT